MTLTFANPWVLWALPLLLLPFLPRARDRLPFPSLLLVPEDRWGQPLQRATQLIAAIALGAIVLALAGPGQPGGIVTREGRGAEAMIMLDRSSSMDFIPEPRGNRPVGSRSQGDSKSLLARRLLTQFVERRPQDRFALMTFSIKPMLVAPFADRSDAVLAGLSAAGVGRGLPRTDMGGAVLAAIDSFADRPYSGSRIIMLVSDGGAALDDATKSAIRAGLARQHIAIYFIYIRSWGNSPALTEPSKPGLLGIPDEVLLHRFFETLDTPYQLFEADDEAAMSNALAAIDRQQNLPLTYVEQLPRRSHVTACLLAAVAAAGLLLASRRFTFTSWP